MLQVVGRSGIVDTAITLPSDDEILNCLVAENAIPMRAATKLEIPESEVLACVMRNARKLSTRLRSMLMLSTYTTLIKTQATLQSVLADMPPEAVGRTYAASVAAFTQLSGQFEELVEDDRNDDATVAKQWIVDRIASIDQREQTQTTASQIDSESEAG